MKIFVAGGTGALGRRLVPLLVSHGHDVVATTRTSAKSPELQAAGAKPVVLDALDRNAVFDAVLAVRPDAVVHQMTALGSMRSLRRFDAEFAGTNRLRTEATAHLLAAARASGATRFVAQSYTGWPNAPSGGRVKTEADPLDPDPPASMQKTLDAIRELERSVTASDLAGIVLRYGAFYGPGTAIAAGGEIVHAMRRRRLPIVGRGTGVWSFIHIDDAAEATRLAIERGAPGIYNIVDDEPAEASVWLPELARAIGAKPPAHVPVWIARLIVGAAGVSMMTQSRGSSNAKAKRELGWQPRCASWRDGFREISTGRLQALPDRVHLARSGGGG